MNRCNENFCLLDGNICRGCIASDDTIEYNVIHLDDGEVAVMFGRFVGGVWAACCITYTGCHKPVSLRMDKYGKPLIYCGRFDDGSYKRGQMTKENFFRFAKKRKFYFMDGCGNYAEHAISRWNK